jgi:hypothetical protein
MVIFYFIDEEISVYFFKQNLQSYINMNKMSHIWFTGMADGCDQHVSAYCILKHRIYLILSVVQYVYYSIYFLCKHFHNFCF